MYIVVYSGGMDSFTLLHHVLEKARGQMGFGAKPETVIALGFNYKQRHKKELDYATAECARLGIERYEIEMPTFGGSALTTPEIDVPEGHYESETMKQTVVAGRNTIMLALAMGFAEMKVNQGTGDPDDLLMVPVEVYYGAHSGDHAIYPDCRPGFLHAMQETYWHATEGRVLLKAPFIKMNKTTILQEGQRLGLTADDYARSWTCYKGEEHACGVCGSCQERAEAFTNVGWLDPALAHFREQANRQV